MEVNSLHELTFDGTEASSEAFTLGVEVGILYKKMDYGEDSFTILIHDKNLLVLDKIARYYGYFISCEKTIVGEWLSATFTKSSKEMVDTWNNIYGSPTEKSCKFTVIDGGRCGL